MAGRFAGSGPAAAPASVSGGKENAAHGRGVSGLASWPPWRMPRRPGAYQIFTCLAAARTIASPVLHWNALAKVGMFDGAPIARNFIGECGSAFR